VKTSDGRSAAFSRLEQHFWFVDKNIFRKLVFDDVRSEISANHLTLAFIDPTGLQINSVQFSGLVQNRKVDLLMTLQFGMGIKRNLQQYIRAEACRANVLFWGTPDAEDASAGGTASQVVRRITNRYMQQLREMGYPKHFVTGKSKSGTTKNVFLYFMAFASRHPWEVSFGAKLSRLSGRPKTDELRSDGGI